MVLKIDCGDTKTLSLKTQFYVIIHIIIMHIEMPLMLIFFVFLMLKIKNKGYIKI